MTIGDFSRSTRLSAKALRLYHQVGLLEPWRIDAVSGYRIYSTDQLVDAQLIRQLRSYDMPLDEIREVLSAGDVSARSEVIARHLERMRREVDRARSAVTGLRSLLDSPGGRFSVVQREVPATYALVSREVINLSDLGDWYDDVTRQLREVVQGGAVVPTGSRGGLWSTELIVEERGEAALFVPIGGPLATPELRGGQRVELLPAATLAVAIHQGRDETVGWTYGALGEYVAHRGIGAEGPVREYYLQDATEDGDGGVTEIGWPVSSSARHAT